MVKVNSLLCRRQGDKKRAGTGSEGKQVQRVDWKGLVAGSLLRVRSWLGKGDGARLRVPLVSGPDTR